LTSPWVFATDTVTADITLYAKWVDDSHWGVAWELNDGAWPGGTTPESEVIKGCTITKPEDPEKTGYGFDGWYDVDLTTPWVFATDTVTEDITLYAKWTIKTYTVTFDVNGGDPLGEGEGTQTVNHGAAIGTLPEPTRTGYGFDGWYDVDLTTPWVFTDTVTADITLYAKWDINTYTVTFDMNDGDPLGEGQDTLTVNHGAAIGALPEPTRTNYDFAGWFTQDGVTQYSATSPVTADITLYAHWTINTVWDGNSIAEDFAGGDGTQENPYRINTPARLAYLAQQVNAGTNYAGTYFTLTGDLDLNGKEWTAIGDYTHSFRGSFDGDGHVISGLFINKPGAGYQGLFGFLEGTGTGVSNLGLEGVAITGRYYVGGIAGYVNSGGSIENCYSTGAVSGTDNIGGIAGRVYNGGSIENCYSTGAVSGTSSVGGIAGKVNSSSIENCYSTGAVSGTDLHVGGIAGEVNSSSIENCYSTGAVSGSISVGGIAGYVDSCSIENCYSTGAVSGGDFVGGIAGRVYSGNIENCAALNPSVKASGSNAGRVAGSISGSDNTFTGNVAWDTMGTGGGKAFKEGTDYNGTLQAKTVFHSATGFPFTVNADPWTYTTGKLPILGGLEGQSNALPAHLQ
jgi:uncharacterized repeat protein (TIGR02543 family)